MLGCIDMASETKGRSNCGAGGARALYRRSDSGGSAPMRRTHVTWTQRWRDSSTPPPGLFSYSSASSLGGEGPQVVLDVPSWGEHRAWALLEAILGCGTKGCSQPRDAARVHSFGQNFAKYPKFQFYRWDRNIFYQPKLIFWMFVS
jgi:hypothetical protein